MRHKFGPPGVSRYRAVLVPEGAAASQSQKTTQKRQEGGLATAQLMAHMCSKVKSDL